MAIISPLAAHEGAAREPVEIFVSPTGKGSGTQDDPASLNDGIKMIRQHNEDAAVTVNLHGGIYRLEEPIVLSTADSGYGGQPVVIRNVPEEFPIISGGRVVDHWETDGSGIMTARVGFAPIGSLYVNGRRATLARMPEAGSYHTIREWNEAGPGTAGHIAVDAEILEGKGALRGARIVLHRNWAATHLEIERVLLDGGIARIEPSQPWRASLFSRPVPAKRRGQPFFLENSIAFLDTPGEFYHDRMMGILHYKPRADEDPEHIETEIAFMESLVTIQGKPDMPVHDIVFDGVHFSHSAWYFLQQEGGLLEAQNGWHYTSGTSGTRFFLKNHKSAVTVESANRITFRNGSFSRMDGGAIAVGNWTESVVIEENVFFDVGACGIVLGEPCDWKSKAWLPKNAREVPTGHLIKRNLLTGTATKYPSSSAISAAYARDLLIEENEIEFSSYTGINVGCGWTPAVNASRNNIIRKNRIHDVMRELDDGAGIYTLSAAPGTRIEANHIFNIERPEHAGANPIAGIYLDQGSSGIHVVNNFIDVTELEERRLHRLHLNLTGANVIRENGGPELNDDEPTRWKRIRAEAGVGESVTTLRERIRRLQ